MCQHGTDILLHPIYLGLSNDVERYIPVFRRRTIHVVNPGNMQVALVQVFLALFPAPLLTQRWTCRGENNGTYRCDICDTDDIWFNDVWCMMYAIWYVMCHIWSMICDIWYIIHETWYTYILYIIHMMTGLWFGTFFIFPYIWNNHPNWQSYLSEGLKPPTRYIWWYL